MTDRDQVRLPGPGQPPPRPRFEFRARPSTAAARRPRAVEISFWLWLGAAAVGLVSALLMVVELDTIKVDITTIIARDYAAETTSTKDRVIAVVTAVLVGGGMLIAGLQAVGAHALHAGRGGARLWLVLLAVISVVHALLAVGVVSGQIMGVLTVGVLLGVAAAVAMLLPGNHRWFAYHQR